MSSTLPCSEQDLLNSFFNAFNSKSAGQFQHDNSQLGLQLQSIANIIYEMEDELDALAAENNLTVQKQLSLSSSADEDLRSDISDLKLHIQSLSTNMVILSLNNPPETPARNRRKYPKIASRHRSPQAYQRTIRFVH